ncbi:prepilin peptidase [Salinispira pacifica]
MFGSLFSITLAPKPLMSPRLILNASLLLIAVPISIVDLRERRVPDILSVGGTVAVLGLGAILRREGFLGQLLGMAAGTTAFWSVRFASGRKLGWGDVKFSALIGAALGPAGWFWAVMAASLLGLAVAGFLRAFRRIDSQAHIPFAPFLTAGALFSAIAAESLTGLLLGVAG